MSLPARSYDLFDEPDDAVESLVAARSEAGLAAPSRRRTRRVILKPPDSPRRRRARRRDEQPASRPPRQRRKDPAASPQAPRVVQPDDVEDVAAPPEPVTPARAPFVVLVLTLVAAGIVGLLVLNAEINQNSFQLKALRDRQAELDVREQQLTSALAEKQSPGNLAAAARRLGLVPAGTPAFLQLPDGRVLGVPRPGGAEADGTPPPDAAAGDQSASHEAAGRAGHDTRDHAASGPPAGSPDGR